MSEATDMKALYLAAEKDILTSGQTTRIGDQLMTTADLPDIQRGRKEWEAKVNAEENKAAGNYSPIQTATARFD